jgi:hypothetical protein
VASISPVEVRTTPFIARASNPVEWGAKWVFPLKRCGTWKGGLGCGLRIKFSSTLLLNGSNLACPGRQFEEVLHLFKRVLLLPGCRVMNKQ